MAETNRYLELSRLDCSHGIEVKHGGLQYLKWSVAWHLLMTKHPDATYYYDDPITLADGTMLVRTGVTVGQTTLTMQLPVLDHRNKPLSSPNSFDYNTAAQRCLTKNIAMFGVGISLYHGDTKVTEASNYEKAEQFITAQDSMGFHEFVHSLSERDQTDAFNDAPPGRKSAYKSEWRALMKVADSFLDEVASSIGDAAANDDEVLLAETISELSTYERKAVWGRLDVAEQEYVQRARSAT
jgi:hypothetical protein